MLGLLSRRGLGICALLGILLLALNALVFYTSSQAVLDHEHLVTHTQDVLGTLDNTLTTILDAETGQHGYIIIADESYLAPYSRAIPFWPRSWIGRLRCPQTTRDSRHAWPRCGRYCMPSFPSWRRLWPCNEPAKASRRARWWPPTVARR